MASQYTMSASTGNPEFAITYRPTSACCRYVDQGGGKRKGAFAIYLEPWHADIFDWLDLRKNHGKEEVGSWSGQHCTLNLELTLSASTVSAMPCVCAGTSQRPLLRTVDHRLVHAKSGSKH